MFDITEAAANQIKHAAQQGGTVGMVLRLAASMKEDGSIDYLMGFDEATDEDIRLVAKGIEIVMVPESVPLLEDAVMDYVELNAGDFRFIFSNPMDANYSPPTEK
ncbi:MAG: iron-sulfur cluster assembly accessory protein [Gammaproteobacteria bacterium]|nr:iron-sulfur cluster assembly accessory protein [Gammaproteobacteria bacterium]MCB1860797.1 iron-sulfur cluster assembly accessory protein [Gammaproteobacteria bacterium]MCB1872718.1 iron-sulfur cluster assembly accessory protein [Gammaproteobacteria bacterium]MCB1880592.1 iron-sulfur cluster assembly accessory protein [Gammaproteobacteria bacterium]MCB1904247.1 iron-sulfur cluster assembly accessory protein [Gammaproteobacteria bacterium]